MQEVNESPLMRTAIVVFAGLIVSCGVGNSNYDPDISLTLAFGLTRELPEFTKLEIAKTWIDPKYSDHFLSREEMKDKIVFATTDVAQIRNIVEALKYSEKIETSAHLDRSGDAFHLLFYSEYVERPAYVFLRIAEVDGAAYAIVRPGTRIDSIRWNRKVLDEMMSVGVITIKNKSEK